MKLDFAPPTLRGLDGLNSDVLAVGVFRQDRPLPELAGLVDWRLNGQVSDVLARDRFEGTLGETVLLPCGDRIGAQRFLLFGLGESKAYTEGRFAEAAERMWNIAFRLLAFRIAMPFPGAHRCAISPRRAARLLISAAGRVYGSGGEELHLDLLVDQAARREIQSALEEDRTHQQIDFIRDQDGP